jgi:hypothetical protein
MILILLLVVFNSCLRPHHPLDGSALTFLLTEDERLLWPEGVPKDLFVSKLNPFAKPLRKRENGDGWQAKAFERIAVVGLLGSIANSSCGARIDDVDVVIRFNFAVSGGVFRATLNTPL